MRIKEGTRKQNELRNKQWEGEEEQGGGAGGEGGRSGGGGGKVKRSEEWGRVQK